MTTIHKKICTIAALAAIAVNAAAQTVDSNDAGDMSQDGVGLRFDDSALQRIMPTRFG